MNLRSRVVATATVLLAVLATTAACDQGSASDPATLSASQLATGGSLNPKDFAALASKPGVVLLDVRTAEEFAAGHLTGARLLDVEAADAATAFAALDPGTTYAVYCRSGNRSKVAVGYMAAAGITSVADLDGGIAAWQSAGGEVVTD